MPPERLNTRVNPALRSAAAALVELRGFGTPLATLPHAAHALDLPLALRSLEPRPVYARAPDARPAGAA
jgi:hypothetical protein